MLNLMSLKLTVSFERIISIFFLGETIYTTLEAF